MSANLVVLELKPEEVEFLNNPRRCALCDHLGALHEDFNAGADGEHCEFCEESSGACEGVSPLIKAGLHDGDAAFNSWESEPIDEIEDDFEFDEDA